MKMVNKGRRWSAKQLLDDNYKKKGKCTQEYNELLTNCFKYLKGFVRGRDNGPYNSNDRP